MVDCSYNVIGVMSGTSLDGIDLCYINFCYNGAWSYSIIHSQTISYSNIWVDALQNAMALDRNALKQLDNEYTVYLNQVLHEFIVTKKITTLYAICSHGHTVLHQPQKGITYQIGNMPHIAEGFDCPVVCDFRVADVKLGGQGAPLVPIGDALLFSEFDVCLNLGGFANISFECENKRIAYDICPVNIILNFYAKTLGVDYDNNGSIAKSGTIDEDLLEALNALTFYTLKPPKSLGLEWVKHYVLPLIMRYELPVPITLRTLVAHIAIQISKAINKLQVTKVLVTGGGAYNSFLIEQLLKLTDIKTQIIIPSRATIDYKEALIFGLLGLLKLRGETNCLSSVTGAKKNHSSGYVY